MKPILEIANISKKFVISHQKLPYLSLRDKLSGMFSRSGKDKVEEFWALKDVSFQIQPGESVGVIGKNGAGKSTLLKILSRITPPTSGYIVSRGRIASLLEVGTGFHQELTGRENIFMNGSILGMRRREIQQRFDEIVSFSGIEQFLDTPLKHYSSGMQLRLAFAVAAHLDPEILIIDEVLAVGDSEFQKKCIKKMEDVAGEGRTLLFVSHNLSSLKAICKTGFLLQKGQLVKAGAMEEVVDFYTENNRAGLQIAETFHYFTEDVRLHDVKINGSAENSVTITGNKLSIELDVEFQKRVPFELDVHIKKDDVIVASYANFVMKEIRSFDKGRYRITYDIELPEMRSAHYQLDLFLTDPFKVWFGVSENSITIEVINSNHHMFLGTPTLRWGSVLLNGEMKVG